MGVWDGLRYFTVALPGPSIYFLEFFVTWGVGSLVQKKTVQDVGLKARNL